jgi:hypothetical protein
MRIARVCYRFDFLTATVFGAAVAFFIAGALRVDLIDFAAGRFVAPRAAPAGRAADQS